MRAKWNEPYIIAALVGVLILGALAIVTLSLTLARPQPDQLEPAQTSTTGDSETVEARVVRVIETSQRQVAPGQSQPVQRLELEILSGPLRGQRTEVEHGAMGMTSEDSLYREGDHVLAMVISRPGGGQSLMITDVVRVWSLALLAVAFVALTMLVSGWKGARALAGLAISFVVLMGFVLPQILAGRDPVLVSVIGSFILLAITLYLTQGWTLKTHAALLGVLFSLILTGALASFAVDLARLNGFGSEEAMFLQAAGTSINVRGLLLAGMIVGTLGVLDDVIVGQASTVMELALANPAWGWRELYRRAMNVGHDHIAAMINTLALAYVGAAMPLLLLFQLYPEPWLYTLNRELIAEEVARTLVGSLGLTAAVPITTIIASLLRHSTKRWGQT
ncbi:MAG: YibE/F family protein [Thermoflexales bacterium]|nr:YibE/F family protein [Thermoflexales bacterium]